MLTVVFLYDTTQDFLSVNVVGTKSQ